MWIYFMTSRSETVTCHIPDLPQNVFTRPIMILLQIALKLRIIHFIATLKFSIIFTFFLNTIISQMHKLILKISF